VGCEFNRSMQNPERLLSAGSYLFPVDPERLLTEKRLEPGSESVVSLISCILDCMLCFRL